MSLALELSRNLILCWNCNWSACECKKCLLFAVKQGNIRKAHNPLKGETIMSQVIDFNYDEWYVWGVQVGCRSAERQTCLEPKFLHANPSKFHDQQLEQVTTQINE